MMIDVAEAAGGCDGCCVKMAARRANGHAQGRNEPGELPRIAQVLAELRGVGVEELAQASARNAGAALRFPVQASA